MTLSSLTQDLLPLSTHCMLAGVRGRVDLAAIGGILFGHSLSPKRRAQLGAETTAELSRRLQQALDALAENQAMTIWSLEGKLIVRGGNSRKRPRHSNPAPMPALVREILLAHCADSLGEQTFLTINPKRVVNVGMPIMVTGERAATRFYYVDELAILAGLDNSAFSRAFDLWHKTINHLLDAPIFMTFGENLPAPSAHRRLLAKRRIAEIWQSGAFAI